MNALSDDEVLETYQKAEFRPFTIELRNKFNAFDVFAERPMFAQCDGLTMVKNNHSVQYISENGHFHGWFTVADGE